MKQLLTLFCVVIVQVLSAQEAHTDEQHDERFELLYGGIIEPHIISKEFYMPVLGSLSLTYKEKVRITGFSGYMFSKHMTAPMLGARVGYEVPMGEKSFVEPYVKTEKIFTHHPYTYYAVGFAYGLKLSKYFTPAISFEYGSEHHEKSVMMGIEIPLNLQFHLKKKRL